MTPIIALDSGPLGLLFQRRGVQVADECRTWLRRHLAAGRRFIVPEIVDYELRRELLRLGNAAAVADLDAFAVAEPDRYLPLNTVSLRLAAELWADLRKQGTPTADRHALDVDVILASQLLTTGWKTTDFVIATTNVIHLARVVPAEQWQKI